MPVAASGTEMTFGRGGTSSVGAAGAGAGVLLIGSTAVTGLGVGTPFAGPGCGPSLRRFIFCQTTNTMSARTSVPASTIRGSHEPEDFGAGAALKVSSGSAFGFGCPAARFVRYW